MPATRRFDCFRAPRVFARAAVVTAASLLAVVSPVAGQPLDRPQDQRLEWDEDFWSLPEESNFGESLAMSSTGSGLALVASPDEATWTTFRYDGTQWTLSALDVHLSPDGPQPYAGCADGDKIVTALRWGSDLTFRVWPDSSEEGDPLVTGINGAVGAVAKHAELALAVGQPDYDGGDGRILIYNWSNQFGWVVAQVHDGTAGERLGASLSFRDGNVLVAGAPGYGDNGAIKVYVRWSGGWFEYTRIDSPAGAQTNAEFGAQVATVGSWIVVGSPRLDRFLIGGAVDTNVGAVYFYDVEGLGWSLEQYEWAPSLQEGARFGTSVAVRPAGEQGAVMVAGSPGEDHTAPISGAAYLFHLEAGEWVAKLRLYDSTGTNTLNDNLGNTVALGPHGVLVGSLYYDGNGISNQGAVLFYKGIVPLFYDGFETGDETAWSASVP
jgi:hypothetical protein